MNNYSAIRIDCLQYCNWSEKIFRQMKEGGISAVHVTIAYHELFREMVANIECWNRRFEQYSDLIIPGRQASDVYAAQETGRTAIFFGFQNCSPIEDDIGLLSIVYALGVRFMQLTYNNQSLLATGCYESTDSGLTRMGKAVVQEMNRVGLVIDMSHSGERSTLEAIEFSQRPIAITHANPSAWHPALRNKSDLVIKALAQSGGMLGFSMYPHHLQNGSSCTLRSFCEMVANTAEKIGVEHIGVGSDLTQDQPDTVVEWMRTGRWSRTIDYGEGTKENAGFPEQPRWFRDNRDFSNLEKGLSEVGFTPEEIANVVGGNWLRFFDTEFKPQ